MSLEAPNNYETPREWFLYFRVTKNLFGMADKFEEEIAKVPDAMAAYTVMTAYGACALDVLLTAKPEMNIYLVDDLHNLFRLTPGHLLTLSIADIAEMAQFESAWLEKRLSREGFRIQDGRISGYADPMEEFLRAAAKPGPKPPSP